MPRGNDEVFYTLQVRSVEPRMLDKHYLSRICDQEEDQDHDRHSCHRYITHTYSVFICNTGKSISFILDNSISGTWMSG